MESTFKPSLSSGLVYGEHSVAVYYEDTDHSGSVYHSNYLKFLDRAREHLIGLELMQDLARDGLQFVVYDISLRYLKPANHGDILTVKTKVHYSQSPKVHCEQSVYKHAQEREQLLVKGHVDIVMVNSHHRPTALPAKITDRFHELAYRNHLLKENSEPDYAKKFSLNSQSLEE